MAKRNKVQEDKDYAELVAVDDIKNISSIKKIIGGILPNDIKVVSKNESQKELIKSIKNNEITICSGPAGSGKAQPLDSLVLGANGFVRMGDIKLGENIFTMSGELTKVTSIFPQGNKKIYEVTFSDNSTTECCEEHLWLTKSERDRENNKGYKVRQLSEMMDDFLKKRDGRKNYSIPITNPINFSEKNITIDPYLMGILIGDGCFCSPNVRLTTVDSEIITEFNNLLPKKYKLSQLKLDVISYNIVFSTKYDSNRRFDNNYPSFKKLISDYGLDGHKSDEKFIPNVYKLNSIENRIKLLQGLMDSDGTISNKGSSLIFSTSSIKLIEDFRFLVESLGGVVNKLRTKKCHYIKNDIKQEYMDSYSYSFRIPNTIIPFRLKRKLEFFKPKTKYFPIRYIKNIRYVGEKECQCIMVDDSSHTYLTDNLIVTHNTFVAIAYALSLLRKTTNRYKKIYLVKSVTTLKNEEIGYLKGGLEEKIEPFMWSFYINMEKIIIKSLTEQLIAEDIIRPFPLAYMRGASLDDCIIIADECIGGNNKLIVRYGGNNKSKHIKAEKLLYYYDKYDDLEVLSHNDNTNEDEFKPINSIRISNNKETLKINVRENGNDIIVTKNHPFALFENGIIKYKPACELKIGDRLLKRKNKSGNHSVLNINNYDILLGFLLGDGCIQGNKRWDDFIFRIRKQHSIKQHEYNTFCGMLYNVSATYGGKSGFNGEQMSVIQTKSYYIEKDFIKSILDENGRKRITEEIVEYMTPRTLATWFMDDGSNYMYTTQGSNITLHTEGFSRGEVEILSNILDNKFGIVNQIETVKKKRKDRKNSFNYYYNIRIGNNESKILQVLICEYIHPSMEYKLNAEFRGRYKEEKYLEYKNNCELTTSIITNIKNNESITVYNMEVADNNNYYVNNILTHNCQNVTLDNARTLLTRIGSNCKLILLGDTNQIDLKNKTESSLEIILNLFEGVENFGVIRMSQEDTNVRNPIITTIEEKFKEYYETKILLDGNNNNMKYLMNEVEKIKKLNGNGK